MGNSGKEIAHFAHVNELKIQHLKKRRLNAALDQKLVALFDLMITSFLCNDENLLYFPDKNGNRKVLIFVVIFHESLRVYE